MLIKEHEIITNFVSKGKFVDPKVTQNGDERAYVELENLETLWFNTGTRCDLECANCYIESSPSNDALSFIGVTDVQPYLDEIKQLQLDTKTIAFTGGEPFLNKSMCDIIELCLARNFKVVVLTNAYKLINKYLEKLTRFNTQYPEKLSLRVSLDHYTKDTHEGERGKNTFDLSVNTLAQLTQLGFDTSIAGRSVPNESGDEALLGYQKLMDDNDIPLSLKVGDNIVIFPEMSSTREVPEISISCWNILGVKPSQQMCATERMIVKRKGQDKPVVLPCTLIAYNEAFEIGNTLKESFKPVYLNHPYCSQFCVLGGASCLG